MSNLVPVSFARHGQKQLLPRSSWTFAAGQQATALLVAEFPVAAHHLPIFFVKINDKFTPAALLGLQRNTNAMIDGEGKWRGDYIPAILRRHPFVLIRKEKDSDDFVLCVDEESGMLVDSGGDPLFTADGQQAPPLVRAMKFAEEYLKQAYAGELFCDLLAEHGLLAPLVIKRGGEDVRLEGINTIDEKKFNALSDEAFLKLRAAGVLSAIYAHFFSLRQIRHLTGKKS